MKCEGSLRELQVNNSSDYSNSITLAVTHHRWSIFTDCLKASENVTRSLLVWSPAQIPTELWSDLNKYLYLLIRGTQERLHICESLKNSNGCEISASTLAFTQLTCSGLNPAHRIKNRIRLCSATLLNEKQRNLSVQNSVDHSRANTVKSILQFLSTDHRWSPNAQFPGWKSREGWEESGGSGERQRGSDQHHLGRPANVYKLLMLNLKSYETKKSRKSSFFFFLGWEQHFVA